MEFDKSKICEMPQSISGPEFDPDKRIGPRTFACPFSDCQ